MVSFTQSFKNKCLKPVIGCLCLFFCLLTLDTAQAQSTIDMKQTLVERLEEEVVLSAQVEFELPTAVEDALLKGIPIYFVYEADILRERWYWYDKKIESTERHLRLAYQPLTRRWRLNVTGRDTGLGLALNQPFDTLAQAMSAIKRLSRWKIAETADLDANQKYKVDLRFRLDLAQLPRPFQIGALGQSDWDLAVSSSLVLLPASTK